MDVAAYSGLFLNSFLSATILPFASEPLFVGLLMSGYAPFWCLLVAATGNVLGGFTNLLLGRGSRSFFEKRVKKGLFAERLIVRYGAWVAWFSWVPVVGDPLLIAAGFYRTPLATTVVFMAAGKVLRYGVIWYVWSLAQ